jgi:hypothetical protein
MVKLLYKKNRYTSGYIALISVILIAAIGTAIMVSVIASGVTMSKTDLSLQQAGSARSLATSCAEEALQKILETGTTSSSGSVTLTTGSCTYTIASQNGQQVTINATGVQSTIIRKIKVVIATTTPSITLSSWEEVVDF